jgi:hypothetical protein
MKIRILKMKLKKKKKKRELAKNNASSQREGVENLKHLQKSE